MRGKETNRREDQAADLHLKSGVAPRIAVHDDSTDVADCFAEASKD